MPVSGDNFAVDDFAFPTAYAGYFYVDDFAFFEVTIAVTGAKAIAVTGSDSTGLVVTGNANTGLAVTGSDGTGIEVTGNQDMAVECPISCFRGEKIIITDTVDADTDITGETVEFNLKEDYDDADPLLTVAGVVVNADTLTVTLTADETDLKPKTYRYDIWRTTAGAEAELTYGTFDIKRVVRRR